MTISEKISILRRDAGMSQDELAEKLDVSRQSISKWESGKVLPDSDKILALSQLFDVSTDFLLKDSEEFLEEEIEEPEAVIPSTDSKVDTAEFPAMKNDSDIPKKTNNKWKKIVAIVAAVCILITAIALPYKAGAFDKLLAKVAEEPVSYPYILVHGLGGWGPESKINETVPYWGNSAGNLAKFMTEHGDETYEASVGPFSSTWDRTCELYAQLTGTTVDYGEAHSKAHGHERYGKQYTVPLFEGWGTKTKAGQIKKINLVGHSFGGETVRLLTSLMAYGNDAEKETDGEISPLFEGGKADWINSVTTLCSPHNGSTLFYVVDQYKLVDLILDLVYKVGGISSNTPIDEFYDFRLDQFNQSDTSDLKTLINDVFSNGTDNAAYDLSPHGAAELNSTIKTVEGIYYFSYSYVTTQASALTGKQVPVLKTLPILMPTATLMGRYSENNVTDFKIDETWLPNDGLVNVVSAKYPTGEEWQEFDSENIVKGKWNVMPTRDGDHGTVIGLYADAQSTRDFYTELTKMIDSQPRDKKFYVSLF